MKIGLIDVDGHNFPNLALMKISAYHKAQGDEVEWWWGWSHYDIVYKSKVFSDAYSEDVPDPLNADIVIKGGTGYAISLVDGKEVYNKENDKPLAPEIESMSPDYSIYPQYRFALSQTTRGCPRNCPFCHVTAKEGKRSVKTSDVYPYFKGQKEIKVLDPNITASKDCLDLLEQYAKTRAWCDFTQGVDARLLTRDKIEAFNDCKIKRIHFAWDDIKQSDKVLSGLEMYKKYGSIKDPRRTVVYVLTNFDTSHEQDLYRVNELRKMGFDPDVRIYNKQSAPRETRLLQRWVNNKIIFKSCPNFEDYDPKKG